MSKKVFLSGCFDVFHSGHVQFLVESGKYGPLYVCVASDQAIRNLKKREPVYNQEERVFIIENFKGVEKVFLSDNVGVLNMKKWVEKVKPDLFIVCEDGDIEEKRKMCSEMNVEYLVLERKQAENLPKRSTTSLICDGRFDSDESRLLEIIASCIHDGWYFAKKTFGYRFGFERNWKDKIHCHLLPFLACGEKNRKKDLIIASKVLKAIRERECSQDSLAKLIHECTVEMIPEERRKGHFHASKTWEEHDDEGRLEHLTQAEMVLNVWENFKKNKFSAMD